MRLRLPEIPKATVLGDGGCAVTGAKWLQGERIVSRAASIDTLRVTLRWKQKWAMRFIRIGKILRRLLCCDETTYSVKHRVDRVD